MMWLMVLTGVVFGLICFMLTMLVQPEFPTGIEVAYTVPPSFVAGILFARWVTISVITKKFCVPIGRVLQFWTFEFCQELIDVRNAKNREQVNKLNPTFVVDNAEAGENTAKEGLIKKEGEGEEV